MLVSLRRGSESQPTFLSRAHFISRTFIRADYIRLVRGKSSGKLPQEWNLTWELIVYMWTYMCKLFIDLYFQAGLGSAIFLNSHASLAINLLIILHKRSWQIVSEIVKNDDKQRSCYQSPTWCLLTVRWTSVSSASSHLRWCNLKDLLLINFPSWLINQ